MGNESRHVIIAGLPRSGSTSLYTYLLHHPQICASNVKETQHFLPAASGLPIGSRAAYLQFFSPQSNEKVFMEASPSYFFGGNKVASAIRNTLGEVNIIFIFRDPAHRLFSYFTHEIMFGNLEKEVIFEEFIRLAGERYPDAIASGYYEPIVREWHQLFPLTIKPIYFDDLQQQPYQVMVNLCEWLGIDPSIYHDFEFTNENRSALYRNKTLHMMARSINTRFETFLRRQHRLKRFLRGIYYTFNEAKKERSTLKPETYEYLANIYRPYNQQLYQFMSSYNYPISGWLSQFADEKWEHGSNAL